MLSMKQYIKELEQQIDQINDENLKLKEELELKENNKFSNSSSNEIEIIQKIQNLEKEIIILNNQKNKKKEKILKFKEEIKKLKNEIYNLKINSSGQQDDIELLEQIQSLKDNLEITLVDKELAEEKIKELEEEINSLKIGFKN